MYRFNQDSKWCMMSCVCCSVVLPRLVPMAGMNLPPHRPWTSARNMSWIRTTSFSKWLVVKCRDGVWKGERQPRKWRNQKFSKLRKMVAKKGSFLLADQANNDACITLSNDVTTCVLSSFPFWMSSHIRSGSPNGEQKSKRVCYRLMLILTVSKRMMPSSTS